MGQGLVYLTSICVSVGLFVESQNWVKNDCSASFSKYVLLGCTDAEEKFQLRLGRRILALLPRRLGGARSIPK